MDMSHVFLELKGATQAFLIEIDVQKPQINQSPILVSICYHRIKTKRTYPL